jgi:hypothetical protein
MSELQRVAKLKFPDGELDEFKLPCNEVHGLTSGRDRLRRMSSGDENILAQRSGLAYSGSLSNIRSCTNADTYCISEE